MLATNNGRKPRSQVLKWSLIFFFFWNLIKKFICLSLFSNLGHVTPMSVTVIHSLFYFLPVCFSHFHTLTLPGYANEKYSQRSKKNHTNHQIHFTYLKHHFDLSIVSGEKKTSLTEWQQNLLHSLNHTHISSCMWIQPLW